MRVLVVEDEVPLAGVLRQALEEEGYAVDVALDGLRARTAAAGSQYDAIVLDLMLPALDGRAVLEAIRHEGVATPVLVLTACDTLDDKVSLLDAGADDYLTKPFELDELLARIRALRRRSAGQPSPIVAIGDVEVDTSRAMVRKAGRTVELTGKEYALVELFVRCHGQLVTRGAIYQHVYDDTEDTASNVVEVYVSRLRKKLGKDFIQTRRGLGYLLGD